MHYIFFDESWNGNKELKIGAVIMPQSCYNDQIKALASKGLFKMGYARRVEEIDKFIGLAKGMAVVGVCQLDQWMLEKVTDTSDDIARMARRNHVWSWAVAYTIELALIQQEINGNQISRVDIYHDPMSLTLDHQLALHKTLRGILVKLLQECLRSSGKGMGLKRTAINRIESVGKGTSGNDFNKFQHGVWFADQLLKFSAEEGTRYFTNVQYIDITDYILESKKTLLQNAILEIG